MKYTFPLLIILFTAFQSFSQTYTIQGIIESGADHSIIPGATLLLLDRTDSSTVTGTVTDYEGEFHISNVYPGNYILQVHFIGFERYYRNLNVQGNIDLGRFALEEETQVLGAVEVVAKRPASIQKSDTTQFNASSFKTTKDASGQDLVEKMPGITVVNGKIQAQGEDVQQILVDGKPFFGTDVNAALQNLPAEVVASIQIFDEQSEKTQLSGFDDGERKKTINIVTKPDRRKGQFGKTSGGYGTDDRYQLGASVNFFNEDRRITVSGLSNNINAVKYSADPNSQGDVRTQDGIINTNSFGINYSDDWGDKIEMSASYSYSHRENEADASRLRDYVLPADSSRIYTEESFNNKINEDHRFNMRFDYNINKRNRLLIRPDISLKHDRNHSFFEGRTVTNLGPLNHTENLSGSNNSDYDYNNRMYYSHKFLKPGRGINLRLHTGYHTNSERGTRNAVNTFYNADESAEVLNQQTIRDRTGISWEAEASYTEPLGKHGMVELEYEIGNRINDSDRRLYNLQEEGSNERRILDTTLSNTFQSEYLTHETELGYQYKKDKMRFQVEAEYQHATLQNDQQFPGEFVLNRSFQSVLPSVRFDYEFSESQNMEFDYHTWTQEPSLGQLQNVIDNSNPLQLRTGNPDLTQSYNHWMRARLRGRNPESERTWYASVESSFSDNYIGTGTYIAESATEIGDGVVLEEGSQLSQPENLDGYWNFKTFFNYGMPVEWVKSNFHVHGGIIYTQRPGLVNGEQNFSNSSNFNLGVSLSSNISDKIDFNVYTRSSYNVAENSLRPTLNNNYFNQTTTLRSTWILWKGFVYRADLNHQLNTGLAEGFDNSFTLLNMSLGKKFLKDDRGEISLNVYDLLDQNNNVGRNINELYIEDRQSTVLQRYFMLTFTYNIRNFSKGTSIDDFDLDG